MAELAVYRIVVTRIRVAILGLTPFQKNCMAEFNKISGEAMP